MEELRIANERLKIARDSIERDYEAETKKLDNKENTLRERLDRLDKKKVETAQINSDVEAAADDLIEINAGGKTIAAKRSTLTLLKETRLEALFSGRWDKKLQRDSHGRIFLDVNPVCFEAIVDYLSEMVISSEDNPPSPPAVADEYKHILQVQLELFGLVDEPMFEMPASYMLKNAGLVGQLHDWLEEDGSDGELSLIYRSSRDGLSNASFHSKCDNQGSNLIVIETTCGFVLGGYSNTPWTHGNNWHAANKAFLFVLNGSGVTHPCKMKLKNENNGHAVCHYSSPSDRLFGFGRGHDLYVSGSDSTVYLSMGHSYETGPLQLLDNGESYKTLAVREMEVFQVVGKTSAIIAATKEKRIQPQLPQVKSVTIFTEAVNEAINAKHESLLRAESEVLHLEESFNDEVNFISEFVSGHSKDLVVLNVSGTIMATQRSTLQIVEDSVLAQQFDDSKWTAQGCITLPVKDWTADDVTAWAKDIHGIEDDVRNILKESNITGCELLALGKDGLRMLGIGRVGTMCLLLKEIKMLEKSSLDVITFVEHSAYCFSKILDYLRLKRLHCRGLAEEPALPTVADLQESRFEKVVKYYFPGESANFILG